MKLFKFPQILIFAIIAVLTFVIPATSVFAYNPDSTHRLLTQKTAQLYGGFSDEEISWLIKGSTGEDTPPRWVNHFYDPKTGQGWNSQRMGNVPQNVLQTITNLGISRDPVSAVGWAHNQNLQSEYALYKGDQTWETAVYHYVRWMDGKNKEDKKKAFTALGHILHLLQDLSVPAHTRQDTHVSGDPYEQWAAGFNSIDNLSFDQTMNCSILDDCFIQMAKYSQENFFSKETINDAFYNYPTPDSVQLSGEDKFYYKDGYLLAIELKAKGKSIEDSRIHSSYFQRLAPKAVAAGVSVLQLFFKEAEIGYQFPQTLKPPLATGLNIPRLSALGEILRFDNFFQNIGETAGKLLGGSKQASSPVITPPLFAVSPQPAPKIASAPAVNPAPQIPAAPSGLTFPSTPQSGTAKENKPSSGSGAAPEVLGWQNTANSAPSTFVSNLSAPPPTPTPTPVLTPTPESSLLPEDSEEQNEPTPEPTTEEPTPEPTPVSTPTPTPEPSAVKILISEIQIIGATANDEFVELYNPNDFNVDLTGYKLKRATNTGNEELLVAANHFNGKSIKSKGFFLLAHPDYTGSVIPDIQWPQSYKLAGNNSLILYNSENKIVDKVGWENAQVFETSPYPKNPGPNQSLERKAFASSTAESMTTGKHKDQGNGYDSDNNSNDFILRQTSDPQDSQSPIEPPPAPLPVKTNIFSETFDDYELGDLNGQGGWTREIGQNAFSVQDINTFDDTGKAIYAPVREWRDGTQIAYQKSTPDMTSGRFSINLRIPIKTEWWGPYPALHSYVYFREGTATKFMVGTSCSFEIGYPLYIPGGRIHAITYVWYAGYNDWIGLGAGRDWINQWFTLQVEFDDSSAEYGQFRVRYKRKGEDFGGWSEWLRYMDNNAGKIDNIMISTVYSPARENSAAGYGIFDDFSFTYPLSSAL